VDIFVGNLSRDVTEPELRQQFLAFGKVTSVRLARDRRSGLSRGFAFVAMREQSEAEAAIAGLRGKTLRERTLDVSEARRR